MEREIRSQLEQEILASGEIEQRISSKYQAEYEKRLGVEKRKMKIELQTKEQELQD
jgi:hypothetical protein